MLKRDEQVPDTKHMSGIFGEGVIVTFLRFPCFYGYTWYRHRGWTGCWLQAISSTTQKCDVRVKDLGW